MHYGDTFRFNGFHKNGCGAKFSVFVTVVKAPGKDWVYQAEDGRIFDDHDYKLVYTCPCGKKCYAKSVVGKYNPGKICNAKCMASTGFQCECSCGGKNHGASHG